MGLRRGLLLRCRGLFLCRGSIGLRRACAQAPPTSHHQTSGEAHSDGRAVPYPNRAFPARFPVNPPAKSPENPLPLHAGAAQRRHSFPLVPLYDETTEVLEEKNNGTPNKLHVWYMAAATPVPAFHNSLSLTVWESLGTLLARLGEAQEWRMNHPSI